MTPAEKAGVVYLGEGEFPDFYVDINFLTRERVTHDWLENSQYSSFPNF